MSLFASPRRETPTLLTLPPELQMAIFSLIDSSSWNLLKQSLGFDPSKFTCHDILDDRLLASAPLACHNRREMAMVNSMSKTNRYFHELLNPYLYSRYGLIALRYCLLEGRRETLHKYFRMTGKPDSRTLDDLVIAASTLRNDDLAQELVRLGARACLIQTYQTYEGHLSMTPQDRLAYALPSIFQRPGNNLNLGRFGSSALLSAVVRDDNHEHVKYLLSQGAMVNMSLGNGALPLHEAVRCGAEQNALILLQYGANPNYRDTSIRDNAIRASECDCPTAMEIALYCGTEKIFAHLAAFGADVRNPRVANRARRVLEMLALNGEGAGIADALFKAGLPTELAAPRNGETLLHYAARGGSIEWLDLLVNHYHVEINALTTSNETACDWAEASPDAQEWLLQHGSFPPVERTYEPHDSDEEEYYDYDVDEW